MTANTFAYFVVQSYWPDDLGEDPAVWLMGTGTPDGDAREFLAANKGSLYSQLDATDDASHVWIKVDEGGDDNDWVEMVTFASTREGSAYSYGLKLDSDVFFTGGAATKSYMLFVGGDRPSGSAATGDSNDAYVRVSGNNYAANDANFIIRGINVAVNNRSGGTLGILENLISIQGKSGGTVPTMRALTVSNENYGTNATESGIADFINRNEANTATLSYGIRIRNDDRSSQGAIQSAIVISSHASSGGFRELVDASGAVLTEYDSGTKVVLMKFQGANATTYYLVHDTDSATAVSVATSVS